MKTRTLALVACLALAPSTAFADKPTIALDADIPHGPPTHGLRVRVVELDYENGLVLAMVQTVDPSGAVTGESSLRFSPATSAKILDASRGAAAKGIMESLGVAGALIDAGPTDAADLGQQQMQAPVRLGAGSLDAARATPEADAPEAAPQPAEGTSLWWWLPAALVAGAWAVFGARRLARKP